MATEKPKTMRNHWFEHVRKTRKKLSKGKPEPISHKEAMTLASATWPEARIKCKQKILREKKKLEKASKIKC